MAIKISDHICKRFIERFNPNLGAITNETDQLMAARRVLAAVVQESLYKSDDSRGILLYNKQLNALIIVRNKTLITIYPNLPKDKRRIKNAK